MKKLFTSESVTEGHPDKICDQISDAILDAILTEDPEARVACETFVTTGLVNIMGEITTTCYVDFQKIVRETICEIGYNNGDLVYFEDDGITSIDVNSLVSLNLFGFTPGVFEDASNYFKEFLSNEDNLDKKEFYLPTVVQKSIDDRKCNLRVLRTSSKFNGMTYKEDLEKVKENIRNLIEEGVYPSNLWGDSNEKK